jgi:hypothetical protein
VVRRYFDACNSGVLEDFKPTLADDVVHYFLPDRFAPIRGAELPNDRWRPNTAFLACVPPNKALKQQATTARPPPNVPSPRARKPGHLMQKVFWLVQPMGELMQAIARRLIPESAHGWRERPLATPRACPSGGESPGP